MSKNQMDKKQLVTILGEIYQIVTDSDYLRTLGENIDGDADHFEYVITTKSAAEYDKDAVRGEQYRREILRHEIVHAFFRQSGMERYQHDEDLVQWLAIQLPKIVRAFREADCMD